MSETASSPTKCWPSSTPQNELNALRSAQAALSAAEGRLVETTNTFDRQKTLLPQGFTTQALFDQAEQALRTAQSQVDNAEAQLQIAKDRVSYSTVAQIGYLFLMFPLALDAGSARLVGGSALIGGLMQAVSHATAKAGMFMAAGIIYAALGHDRIGALGGVVRVAPLAALAFLLAGLALIGPPASGVHLAKTLLLEAAADTQQWWWAAMLQAGGVLTSGYLVLVIAHVLAPSGRAVTSPANVVPHHQQAAALTLVLGSLLLGLLPWQVWLPPSARSGQSFGRS
jgi:NADH:ubiquinone oxidoreductase subunit 5 (subunit L)/multisubunit Na+/H+ antiporter MnhA subunit